MTLTLRNVPDLIHELLRTQARQNRRSVNQEAISVFEEVLSPKRAGRAAEVAQIVARNRELRGRMSRFMTDEEIKAAKEEGQL